MKKDEIVFSSIEILLLFLIIIGVIVFTDGYQTENALNMVGGLALMMFSWVQFFLFFFLETMQKLREETDELKTDLAILQNRCDWIEDDICKEYKE